MFPPPSSPFSLSLSLKSIKKHQQHPQARALRSVPTLLPSPRAGLSLSGPHLFALRPLADTSFGLPFSPPPPPPASFLSFPPFVRLVFVFLPFSLGFRRPFPSLHSGKCWAGRGCGPHLTLTLTSRAVLLVGSLLRRFWPGPCEEGVCSRRAVRGGPAGVREGEGGLGHWPSASQALPPLLGRKEAAEAGDTNE